MTKTEKNQPIEFRLRYPKPKAEEICAFNELIEKVIVNDDVLAGESAAAEEENLQEKAEGLDDIELEEEREKRRKEEEIHPEKRDIET